MWRKHRKKGARPQGEYFQLLYTDGTYQPIPKTPGMRAIVITDSHFSDRDNSYFDYRLVPKTLDLLENLVKDKGFNTIIHLGDLFHGGCRDAEFMLDTLKRIAGMADRFYIVGGNHDRRKLFRFLINGYLKPLKNLVVAEEMFFKLEGSPESENTFGDKIAFRNVYFAHEAGNNFKIRGEKTEPFLTSLKFFHKFIDFDGDLLVTGHVHQDRCFVEKKIVTISPFHLGFSDTPSYISISVGTDGGLSMNRFSADPRDYS